MFAALICSLSTPVAAHLGAPISEPGLHGRGDIIYFQDFEASGDGWKKDVHVDKPYLRPSTHVAFKGKRSLRIRFAREDNHRSLSSKEANHYGGTLHLWFADNGLEEPEELYFRYYLYIPGESGEYPFPDSVIWRPEHPRRGSSGARSGDAGEFRPVEQVDKMPGFAGTYSRHDWGGAGYGLRFPDGTNGWSARMFIKERDDASGKWDMLYYVYHLEDGVRGTNSAWKWSIPIQRETWHCIEGHIRLNSIIDPDEKGHGSAGHADGILRGWIDGRPAFERTDLVFRFDERLKIEKITGVFYIGGDWFPLEDCYLFTDNWVVSSNRIGTYQDSAPAR